MFFSVSLDLEEATFIGSGLVTNADVLIENQDLGTSSYQVGTDGSFELHGGVLR